MTHSMIPLIAFPYGSHLYGMSTPDSDQDIKVIYWPSARDLMMNLSPPNMKFRWDENHQPIGSDQPMPPRGIEEEWIPWSKWIKDYLDGQSYALELMGALDAGWVTYPRANPLLLTPGSTSLAMPYGHEQQPGTLTCAWTPLQAQEALAPVRAILPLTLRDMIQYAQHQVHDYERKIQALQTVETLIHQLEGWIQSIPAPQQGTTKWGDLNPQGLRWLDVVRADPLWPTPLIDVGTGKQDVAVLWNHKQYGASSFLHHTLGALHKSKRQYGHRTMAAIQMSEASQRVDYKSMAHAIRIFEQALEWVQHQTLTMPRPNHAWLKTVRQGQVSLPDLDRHWKTLQQQWNALEAQGLCPQHSIEERIVQRTLHLNTLGEWSLSLYQNLLQSESLTPARVPCKTSMNSLR